MIQPIEPGEALRYHCNNCQREYEIQLEPKVQEMTAERVQDRDPITEKAAAPQYCPFCSSTDFCEV